MKKHLLKLIGILAISACAYAIPADNFGPPITEGIQDQGSRTEVRVTANVVAGIAVNEASPIDFGNLVRGKNVYSNGEIINQRTPGLVTFRADKTGADENQSRDTIFAKLDRDKLNLDWTSANGSNGNGTQTTLKNVNITGLTTKGEDIKLTNGQAMKKLYANFKAYETLEENKYSQEDGNLGKNQKLGSYLGTIIVSANVK